MGANLESVIVTGGAGFLGSHLVKKLLDNDYRVVVLDNLSTSSIDNLSFALDNPNFEFIDHDVNIKYFRKTKYIFNLACPASPVHYQKDAIKTIKTNIFGTINALECARESGAIILQASTSEVYGDPLVHPQRETYWGNVNPIGVRACYDEGKRTAETLFFDYYRTYHLPIKVVRIFNTYGPNMSIYDGRVVSNFIVQALKNEPLQIYGDGTQTRSFCYVDDTIDAMFDFIQTPKGYTGPVNIGNPTEHSVSEIAEIIISLTNSKSTIKYQELPQDDPHRRKPEISKINELTNWEPIVPLREGLVKTIEYFKQKV